MKAAIVYESVYGNTRAIAEAIAEGLGDGAVVLPVSKAGVPECDLLVVGGPTHMHGLASARSRSMAAAAGEEDGVGVEPEAAEEPGLRTWLRELPNAAGARAASFDTRLDRSPWLTGLASHAIAHRLSHRGYEIVARESFLVAQSEGPLEPGELERARAWGAELAASPVTAQPAS
jgi:Flavodoxin domain